MTRDGGWSHPCQISLVKQANEMIIEIHFVDALRHLFQSYQLPNKGPSNKTFSPLPFDMGLPSSYGQLVKGDFGLVGIQN